MPTKQQFNLLEEKLGPSVKVNHENYLYFGGTA